jgi:protein-S-isoprenylcysteine O-methyltransferase Ste14
LKVTLGLCLIAGVVARFVFDVELAKWSPPIIISQLVVCFGVGVYLYHYALLRAANSGLQVPKQLVLDAGLYRWIRHPMYLADAMYYAGLALLWASWGSLLLWLIALLALRQQAQIEDRWCAAQFGQQHRNWCDRTRLLIPYIY